MSNELEVASAGDGKDEGRERSYQGVPVPTSIVEALIQHAIPLAGDIHGLTSATYRIALKPELLRGLRDESLRWMPAPHLSPEAFHLNVLDAKGKIVGQGVTVPAGKTAELASASFQIATFVTAQAHLAQITAQLEEIGHMSAEILAKLSDGREGQLRGDMQYLQIIVEALTGAPGSIDPTWRDQIETIYRNALGAQKAVEPELARRFREIKTQNLDGFIKGEETKRRELSRKLDEYEEAARAYHLTLDVQVVALQLRGHLFPGAPAQKEGLANARRGVETAEVRHRDMVNLVQSRTKGRKELSAHRIEYYRKAGLFRTSGSYLERTEIGPVLQAKEAQEQLGDALRNLKARIEGSERLLDRGIEILLRQNAEGIWEAIPTG